MKTTLDIDDQLRADAKALAAQQRTSLTRVVEEGLHCDFAQRPTPGSAVGSEFLFTRARGVWWLAWTR